MQKYSKKFIFYISNDMKKLMEQRSKDLDISMSDYIRTLIKQDINLNNMAYITSLMDKQSFDIENLNKKLSGFYKGIR